MPKLFISYRRADSRHPAGRLYDRLAQTFGRDNVFKDVDNITPGSDFRGAIIENVSRCDVVLVLIGASWLTVTDDKGVRRLDNPGDFVRIEVETALVRDSCLVIPLLVNNAGMPGADDLPVSLRELAFKHAVPIRDDPDFHNDVDRLIESLKRRFPDAPLPEKPATFNVNVAIGQFFDLFEQKKWDAARALLAEIRASPKLPRAFDVDAHERDLLTAVEQEEAKQEYATLCLLVQRGNPARVWAAIQAFQEIYPDYDPDNLVEKFRPTEPPKESVNPLVPPRVVGA